MKDNKTSDNHEQGVDLSLLPNDYLADVRKKKGIDERQAADALKISVSRFRSLENGDYAVFPSATYVRGHLRKYSRLLDVDEEAIVKAYNAANPPTFDFVNPENNAKDKRAAGGSSSKRSWTFVLIVILLIVLWMAAYNYFAQSSKGFMAILSLSGSEQSSLELSETPLNSTANKTMSGDSDSSVAIKDNAAEDESELMSPSDISDAANLDITELVELDSGDGSVLSLDENINASSLDIPLINSDPNALELPLDSNITTESETAQPEILVSKVTAAELVKSINSEGTSDSALVTDTEPHVLTFSFVNPCWVQVTDAGGTVIFAGLKASNSSLRLTGDAPFKIVLGNIDGTSLNYNDSPVILEPQENGRPLRLTVGSE